MDPAGKVAIITGGSSGIGRATALKLAGLGASIVVGDVDDGGGEATIAATRDVGGTGSFVQVDATLYEDLETLVRHAEDTYGGLDILHNNAGVNTGRPRFPESPRERWERTLMLDLWAVLAGVQVALPAMRRRGSGVIVNTASLAGVVPFSPDPAYSAAKHGVVGLTRSLAFMREEYGIRVNCVCPGVVDTPLLDKRDLTSEDRAVIDQMPLIPPEQVADAVIDLIRDDSLAGQVVGVLFGGSPKHIPTPITLREEPSERMKS